MSRKSIVAALKSESGKHVLRVLTVKDGDYSVEWDPSDSGSVAVAEREFKKAVKNRDAYMSKGGVDTLTREFDPQAEAIVVAPRINGG